MRVLGLPLVLVAMFSVAGGHWAVLQSVAWGQMLWTYSAGEGSWLKGAEKTFSGQHPCRMCLQVAKGMGEETKPAPELTPVKKVECSLGEKLVLRPWLPTGKAVFAEWRQVGTERREAPPVPVPIVQG